MLLEYNDPTQFYYTDANLYDWRDDDDLEMEMVFYGGSLGSWMKQNASRAINSSFAHKLWEGYKSFVAPAIKDLAKTYLPDDLVDKAEAKGKEFIKASDKRAFVRNEVGQTKIPAAAFVGNVGARIVNDILRKHGNTVNTNPITTTTT